MSLWTPPGEPLWTPDGYVNGFIRDPGAHAGYRAGRLIPDGTVVHYTVGRDSTGIGKRGVFAFLFPKVGPGKQFNPWDAVTFHACEWNHRMVGAETEKLGDWEPTTDDQIRSWATLAAALAEKGIAFGYDGSTARVAIGAPLRAPYTAHRTLVHRACDQHTDYLPDEDMERAFALAGGGSGSNQQKGRKCMYIHAETAGNPKLKHMAGKRWCMAPNGLYTEVDATQWAKYAHTGEIYIGDANNVVQLLPKEAIPPQ